MSFGQANLLQGTLHLLILRAVGKGELHGLGISRRIEQMTNGTFLVKPGSLFPALHRMEEAGWLSSFWGESENNRRAKFYRLTKAGEHQLDVETEAWTTVALAMANALKGPTEDKNDDVLFPAQERGSQSFWTSPCREAAR